MENNLFELECLTDELVIVTNNSLGEKGAMLTVFCKDLKEVLIQTSLEPSEKASFYSLNCCRCMILWEVDSLNSVSWAVEKEEVEGLSVKSAIRVDVGEFEARHEDEMDKWFVYTADKTGQVKVSSVGHTKENTTLFIYESKDVEQVIASSNYASGSLQSEVIIDVEAGQSY